MGRHNNEGTDLLDLHEFDEEAYKKESEELLEMRLINSGNASFERTEGGFLSLKFREKEYKRIGVYLTFPLTNPEEFISIREADEKAKEIGIVESMKDLSASQQEMLREQIRLRYFMPEVKKVMEVKEEYGYAYWYVETDFGVCRFTTHMSNDAVAVLDESRLLITDIDGNRYEIPDFYALTIQERKRLDLFM